jgi:hypothetical protein
MANCPTCKQEMKLTVSCTPEPLVIHGRLYEPLRWSDEKRYGTVMVTYPCGDCATPPGGVHHHGCDIEECPACGRQAISCDCNYDWDEQHSDCSGIRFRSHRTPPCNRSD